MIIKEYAVSIQWGSGIHYFLKCDYPDEESARKDADSHAKSLKRLYIKRRGAKPHVHIWKRADLKATKESL